MRVYSASPQSDTTRSPREDDNNEGRKVRTPAECQSPRGVNGFTLGDSRVNWTLVNVNWQLVQASGGVHASPFSDGLPYRDEACRVCVCVWLKLDAAFKPAFLAYLAYCR